MDTIQLEFMIKRKYLGLGNMKIYLLLYQFYMLQKGNIMILLKQILPISLHRLPI